MGSHLVLLEQLLHLRGALLDLVQPQLQLRLRLPLRVQARRLLHLRRLRHLLRCHCQCRNGLKLRFGGVEVLGESGLRLLCGGCLLLRLVDFDFPLCAAREGQVRLYRSGHC